MLVDQPVADAGLSETAIYVVAGAYLVPKMADLVVGFFKGSVTRNINAADKAQEKATGDLEALKVKITEVVHSVERLEDRHTTHKDTMTSALGQIEGRLQALDTRIASQGAKYEEKIEDGFKKLEIELNRKLAQFVGEVSARPPRARRP
jgi:chromosome segregation ATPase